MGRWAHRRRGARSRPQSARRVCRGRGLGGPPPRAIRKPMSRHLCRRRITARASQRSRSRPERTLQETRQGTASLGSDRGTLDHHIVGQSVSVGVDGRAGAPGDGWTIDDEPVPHDERNAVRAAEELPRSGRSVVGYAGHVQKGFEPGPSGLPQGRGGVSSADPGARAGSGNRQRKPLPPPGRLPGPADSPSPRLRRAIGGPPPRTFSSSAAPRPSPRPRGASPTCWSPAGPSLLLPPPPFRRRSSPR